MSLNKLAQRINDTAKAHGFWESNRNFGEMIALAHSELSEALEEHRSGREPEYFQINGEQVWRVDDGSGSDWSTANGEATYTGVLAKPEGVAVELADCIIRCLDTMHSLGVDIDAVVARKMAYNDSRPYKHGRAY